MTKYCKFVQNLDLKRKIFGYKHSLISEAEEMKLKLKNA